MLWIEVVGKSLGNLHGFEALAAFFVDGPPGDELHSAPISRPESAGLPERALAAIYK